MKKNIFTMQYGTVQAIIVSPLWRIQEVSSSFKKYLITHNVHKSDDRKIMFISIALNKI